MFSTNERNVQRSKHSGDPKAGTLYVDNEVRFAVALEFSRMDQQHAHIREEALAPLSSTTTQSEPNDRELA
jgi:hypothetical protein